MAEEESFKKEIQLVDGGRSEYWQYNKKSKSWLKKNIRCHTNPKSINLYDKKNGD